MLPYFIGKMGSSRNLAEKMSSHKEDILTSIAIGGLKYLGRDITTKFIEFLELNLEEQNDFEIEFWPWWKHPDGSNVEPDWVIKNENKDVVIIGESKFGSGLTTEQLEREFDACPYGDKKKIVVALTNTPGDKAQIHGKDNWKWIAWRDVLFWYEELLEDDSKLHPIQKKLIEDLVEAMQAFEIRSLYLMKKDKTDIFLSTFNHPYRIQPSAHFMERTIEIFTFNHTYGVKKHD